mgnify:CR=1 FL=1
MALSVEDHQRKKVVQSVKKEWQERKNNANAISLYRM